MSKCNICNLESDKIDEILEGICEDCEPIWLRSINKLSKTMPSETGIHSLFEAAVEDAKQKITKPKEH